jgi:REP element-mobilizing transposase RayT
MIAITWIGISDAFPSVVADDFIVMPDHFHGLLTVTTSEHDDKPTSLIDVMRWFKGKTRHLYSQGVKHRGWPRYSGTFWQPRFHDHIIRNERDFNARVTYIERNPWRWVENRKPTRE